MSSTGDSYGGNYGPPPNLCIEALTLNMTVLGYRACEEVIKVK